MIYNDLIGKTGRLGNQLWELASTLGIADKRLEPAEFVAWEYEPYFNVRREWFLRNGDAPHGTSVYDLPEVQHLGPVARPYLQDYSFFSHIAPSIREWLRPSEFAEQVLSDGEYDGYWELPRPKLALHIRRGDNATAHERNEQGNHPLRPMSYYVEAANDLRTFRSIAVFSDDIPWCRENIKLFPGSDSFPIHFFEGGPARARECEERYANEDALDWIDLLAMTDCDQFILSNSTYSWWAAFLSGVDGSQIRYPHPRVWFGRKLRNIIDASLMFPADWVPITHEDY